MALPTLMQLTALQHALAQMLAAWRASIAEQPVQQAQQLLALHGHTGGY